MLISICINILLFFALVITSFRKVKIVTKEVEKKVLVYSHTPQKYSLTKIKNTLRNCKEPTHFRVYDAYGKHFGMLTWGDKGCSIVDVEYNSLLKEYRGITSSAQELTWEEFYERFPMYKEEEEVTVPKAVFDEMKSDLDKYHKILDELNSTIKN